MHGQQNIKEMYT